MDERDYYYRDIVDGISDADSSDSSDEDEKVSKRKLVQSLSKHLTKEEFQYLIHADDDNYDDEDSNQKFEREMANEAQNHVNGIHVDTKSIDHNCNVSKGLITNHSGQSGSSNSSSDQTKSNPSTSKKTKEQEEEENDLLFYDPDEDDSNQRWIDSQNFQSSSSSSSSSFNNNTNINDRQRILETSARLKKPKSDATLNCPCCLTLICLDCQRHSLYKTQYRAMFVKNCRIDYQKQLIHKSKNSKKEKFQRSKRKRNTGNNNNGPEDTEEKDETNISDNNNVNNDLYYPVHCNVCNTQVAVYDMNEVYHFFSVIASH